MACADAELVIAGFLITLRSCRNLDAMTGDRPQSTWRASFRKHLCFYPPLSAARQALVVVSLQEATVAGRDSPVGRALGDMQFGASLVPS